MNKSSLSWKRSSITTFLPTILLVITGIVMWFVSMHLFTGYTIGIILGTVFILVIVRKLGKKAQQSPIASELFQKVTSYRVSKQPQDISIVARDYACEYTDLTDILRNQMQFPLSRAKDAAAHAMSMAEGKPLQEKLRVALQYLGNGHNSIKEARID
jgi:MFS superfamily sulfate permease-like transporter